MTAESLAVAAWLGLGFIVLVATLPLALRKTPPVKPWIAVPHDPLEIGKLYVELLARAETDPRSLLAPLTIASTQALALQEVTAGLEPRQLVGLTLVDSAAAEVDVNVGLMLRSLLLMPAAVLASGAAAWFAPKGRWAVLLGGVALTYFSTVPVRKLAGRQHQANRDRWLNAALRVAKGLPQPEVLLDGLSSLADRARSEPRLAFFEPILRQRHELLNQRLDLIPPRRAL